MFIVPTYKIKFEFCLLIMYAQTIFPWQIAICHISSLDEEITIFPPMALVTPNAYALKT